MILKGGAIIQLQNRVRSVERLCWVKPYIQSFACHLPLKAFTESAVQKSQQCLNGWGAKSMASGRSSFNQTHLHQFHKGENLHTFIYLPRFMLGSCHLLSATLPSTSTILHFFISQRVILHFAFLHECKLDPVQGRWQKSTYLWVENLDSENDPASEGGVNSIPNTTHSKAIKQVQGRVCTCVFYEMWKQGKVSSKGLFSGMLTEQNLRHRFMKHFRCLY